MNNRNKGESYLPFYVGSLSCGLFGIADDFIEDQLSLDQKFMKNRESTFFVRAQGDSMAPNILPGDILIVDRAKKVFNGAVVAIFLNNSAICKQYFFSNGELKLKSFNKKNKEIKIQQGDDIVLFGVVIGLARDFY